MAMKSKTLIRISFVMLFAVAAAALYLARAPIRNAAKIRQGDAAVTVHRLLGEPDAVFNTTAELRGSYLGPGSYVFTDKTGRRGIPLSELPLVDARAEWFEYASAGHLVFYDENGVTDVLWGGT